MENKFTALGKTLETLGSSPKFDLSSFSLKDITPRSYLPTINIPDIEIPENPMIEQLTAIIEELKKANENQEIELKNRAIEIEDSKLALKRQKRINKWLIGFNILFVVIYIGQLIVGIIPLVRNNPLK